jgi:hypothetical protein
VGLAGMKSKVFPLFVASTLAEPGGAGGQQITDFELNQIR